MLGLIAGAFTSFASLPQIIYVIKTRSMKDISLVTLSMFAFGVSLWLCYGIVIHAVPVILWNAMSLTLYLTQIGLKVTLSGYLRPLLVHPFARDNDRAAVVAGRRGGPDVLGQRGGTDVFGRARAALVAALR
jgi:MtN3 and saliva related transmembrane protein